MRRVVPLLVSALLVTSACGGGERADEKSPSTTKLLPSPCEWVTARSIGDRTGVTLVAHTSADTCFYEAVDSSSTLEISLLAQRLDGVAPSVAEHRKMAFADLDRPVAKAAEAGDESIVAVGRLKNGGRDFQARGVAREGDSVLVVKIDQTEGLPAQTVRDQATLVLALAALQKFKRDL